MYSASILKTVLLRARVCYLCRANVKSCKILLWCTCVNHLSMATLQKLQRAHQKLDSLFIQTNKKHITVSNLKTWPLVLSAHTPCHTSTLYRTYHHALPALKLNGSESFECVRVQHRLAWLRGRHAIENATRGAQLKSILDPVVAQHTLKVNLIGWESKK